LEEVGRAAAQTLALLVLGADQVVVSRRLAGAS
jgi:hypothetical protein